MIPTPPDPFDEWMRLPVTRESEDPRFVVRRARIEDLEQVWDVVDAAFAKKRPRELYEWLYLRNPTGRARCWVTALSDTGAFIKVGSAFPWPVWRDREVLMGSIGGDAATLPEWQRQGLSAIRRHVRRSHPWHEQFCSFAGPNAGSRAVLQKSGRGETLLGRLRGGVAVIRADSMLERFGLSRRLARPIGAATGALLRGVVASMGKTTSGHLESLARFDTEHDDVTLRTMQFDHFWCPHNADFLNWRYLDHPIETYRAFVWIEDDRPVGYAVLRFGDVGATLAEFAIETQPRARSAAFLAALLETARDAGCAYLDFFASSSWRHWPLLRRAGFLPYASQNQMEADCKRFRPEVNRLENWQVTPGDRDYH